MSALFNLKSLIVALLLTICTSAYLKGTFPSFINHKNEGFYAVGPVLSLIPPCMQVLGKFALVGERLSGYVALGCFLSAISVLVIR